MIASTKKNAPRTVRPRVKVWLESNGDSVLCRGLCDMLRAVEETGSIKSAASRIGRSYRFVWSRIKEAEEAFGATLVETRVGGREANRSGLSPLAQDLLKDFDSLCQQVYQLVDGAFAEKLQSTLQRHGRKP
ncbi:MAG: LysR family transcriptional regulator [Planctomycetes bacterium]|nr:LysR family transcriptional regulator [Planctomycetota bacterium]